MDRIMLSSVVHLSNDELLARVKHLAERERKATASLIAHLAELDERRLYLEEGCSSLFTFPSTVRRLPTPRHTAEPFTTLPSAGPSLQPTSESQCDVSRGLPSPASTSLPAQPGVVVPLAPQRYRVQFTARPTGCQGGACVLLYYCQTAALLSLARSPHNSVRTEYGTRSHRVEPESMSHSRADVHAGAKVHIRQYRAGDAEQLCEAIVESTEQVFPWMDWCHPGYSLDESRAWIEHCEAAWEQGAEYHFAVVDDTDRFLGGCGLNQLRPVNRVANLGYWVRSAATGKSVATAAVRRLTEFAFRETNLVRLEIVVALGNLPSHRVAEKVGAIREGVAHDRLHMHGASQDAIVYALLRSRHRQGD